MRRWGLVVVIPVAACAQVLSYDDYRGRDPISADASPASDTFVEDTQPADAGPAPARVPSRPAGVAIASGTGKTLWLAVRTYAYGLADPSGKNSPTAWASYGYDLDEVCTSERDSVQNLNTCQRPAGAKQDSLIDGERCRDNNVGRNVSNLLGVALPDAEKTLNDIVRSGSTTWILRIDDVDPNSDDPFAPGAFYRSSDDRTTPPKWDGNDDRGVQSDSLSDGDLARPVISFPRGFVSGGVWVSGDPAPLKVLAPMSASGFFPLSLQKAFITLELDPARTTGSHGLVAGVLPASEIEAMFRAIADFAMVCPGTKLYDDTLTSLLRMPDVVLDAPKLQDLDRTCDAASAALGFEVTPIKPVTRIVAPSMPRVPNCGDAG